MSMKPTYEQLEQQLAAVVAENAGLKSAAEFATVPDMWEELGGDVLRYQYKDWYVDKLKAAMKTPATDAAIANIQAQGVEALAAKYESEIEPYKNHDEFMNAHYLSMQANAARKFAAQLRQGVEHE